MSIKLSAIDDQGKPVDWWFIYKVAGKSKLSDGTKADGAKYLYFDSNKQKGEKLHLSPFLMNDPAHGAVANTLNQIYKNAADPDLGWFFYNDEDPITGKTNSSRGHTKGVLSFDLKSDTAFWLIHSAPKFPPKGKYDFPESATDNAQTFLCISLKDAETAKAISAQMFQAHRPNVYLASSIPAALQGQSMDPRVELIKNQVENNGSPYGNFISFLSKAGNKFRSCAKNEEWNTTAGNDFYNDLVGPMLKESLEVETWTHGLEPGTLEGDKVHHIMAMKTVNLAPLGISPSYEWSEENDHAKLVISQKGQQEHFVCVGDINFTRTMERRSGGTVAFQNNDLWNSLIEILSSVNIKTKKSNSNEAKATEA